MAGHSFSVLSFIDDATVTIIHEAIGQRRLGDYATAAHRLDRAARKARMRADWAAAAVLMDNLADTRAVTGDLDGALSCREDGIELAQASDVSPMVTCLRAGRAADLYRRGDLAKAEDDIAIVIKELRNTTDNTDSRALRVLAEIRTAQGGDGARSFYQTAAHRGGSQCRAKAWSGLGWHHLQRPACAEPALQAFRQAMHLLDRRDGAPHATAVEVRTAAGLAIALHQAGEARHAHNLLHTARSEPVARGNRYLAGFLAAAESVLAGSATEARAAALRSDDAFAATARPLVGLNRRMRSVALDVHAPAGAR